jgi:hypothetical protein
LAIPIDANPAIEVSRAFIPPCTRAMSPPERQLSDQSPCQQIHPVSRIGTLATNSTKNLPISSPRVNPALESVVLIFSSIREKSQAKMVQTVTDSKFCSVSDRVLSIYNLMERYRTHNLQNIANASTNPALSGGNAPGSWPMISTPSAAIARRRAHSAIPITALRCKPSFRT